MEQTWLFNQLLLTHIFQTKNLASLHRTVFRQRVRKREAGSYSGDTSNHHPWLSRAGGGTGSKQMDFWNNYSYQYPAGLDPTDPEAFAQGYAARAGGAGRGNSSNSEMPPSPGSPPNTSPELYGLQGERRNAGGADAGMQPRMQDVLGRFGAMTLSNPSDHGGRIDRTQTPNTPSDSFGIPDPSRAYEAHVSHEFASTNYGVPSPGTFVDHHALWQSMPHPEGQISPNMSVPPWQPQVPPQPSYELSPLWTYPQSMPVQSDVPQWGGALEQGQSSARRPSRAKTRPYYSEKPDRQSTVNHNEKAYFPGAEGNEDGLIVCRHLATAWLLQHETAGKPNYEALGDLDAIARNVPRWVEDAYKRVLSHSADVHIVENSDWRSFAAERFRELERSGADSKRMLIESGVHTMAAEFKIKRVPGMPARYVQKLYDPSRTATHKRASTTEMDRIQPTSISKFLPNEQAYQNYFGESEKVFLAVGIPPGGVLNLPPEHPGGYEDRRLSGPLPPLDETVVHHLVANGFGGSLRDIRGELGRLAGLAEEEAADLLAARNLEGDSGLFTAAGKGLVDVIHAYCDVVRHCQLDSDLHAELLAGTSADGAPALFAAMHQGFGDTSRALIHGIATSGLEPALKVELLAARNGGGASALTSALSSGQAQSAAAFVEGVTASDLSHREVFALLKGSNPNGAPPSLALAMAGDKHLAIDAFVNAVANARVPRQMKLKVLRGEFQGHSALQFAVSRGCDAAVAAYSQAVERSRLSFEDKAYLLGAGGPPDRR